MDCQPEKKAFPNNQKLILDACLSGDLCTLQIVLTDIKLQTGSDPEPHRDLTEFLTASIISKQASIVTYLLQMDPSFSLSQQAGIVGAVLNNPDANTLQALCSHDPSFASSSIDYGMRCFITDACARPPDTIVPLLHVLLDNGADVNDGWGPGGGALYAALLGSQPREILDKIVQRGGEVSDRVIYTAIQKKRIDVLENLFRNSHRGIKSEDCVEQARKTGDEEVIALVVKFALEREKELAKRARRNKIKWWQVW